MDNSTEAATNVLSPAGSLHSHADSIPIPERLSPGSSHTAPLPQYRFSNYQVQRSTVVSPATQVVGTPERSSQRPWPLRDPEEARLLQHFVDNVARFVSADPFFFRKMNGSLIGYQVRLHGSPATFCYPYPLQSTPLRDIIQCNIGHVGSSFESHNRF